MAEEFPPGAASSLRGHKIIAAYWQFLQALAARPHTKIVSDDPNVERAIWEAVEAAFRAHGSYFSTDPGLQFPHEISWFVADAFSELLAGGEPESWKVIRHTGKREGAPRRAAPERSHISAAVTYIKAARQGLINDKSPQKTVCEVFGVAASTVRGWCAEDTFKYVNPSQLVSSNPNLGNTLRAMMLDAGHVYQASRRTRTRRAIWRRGAKRKKGPPVK